MNTPRISLVTLGVRDVQSATEFYERLGLKRAGFESESISFFDLGGTALALYEWDALADDAKVAAEGEGFRGVTLAWNQASEEDVDKAVGRFVAMGGMVVKAPEKVFWGGYSGYVSDPCGHLWEISFNPAWPLREDGSLELPPPREES